MHMNRRMVPRGGSCHRTLMLMSVMARPNDPQKIIIWGTCKTRHNSGSLYRAPRMIRLRLTATDTAVQRTQMIRSDAGLEKRPSGHLVGAHILKAEKTLTGHSKKSWEAEKSYVRWRRVLRRCDGFPDLRNKLHPAEKLFKKNSFLLMAFVARTG